MTEPVDTSNPFAQIPAAPTVDVHTLHSDVQAMSHSGGVAMQVEDVTEMIGRKTETQNFSRKENPGGSLVFNLALLVLIVLIAAVIVGFIFSAGFLPNLPFVGSFFSGNSTTTVETASSTATSTSLPGYVPSSSTVNFDPYSDIQDQRFLRISADASVELVLSRAAAQTAEDLLTYPQKVRAKVGEVPSQARFIELDLKKDGDKPADGLTFMAITGAQIFNKQFFTDNFEPNMTAFVYRDQKGIWPGYIFKLLPGKNTRSLDTQIQFIERSTAALSLFLESPGNASGTFMDGVRTGLPTREQKYTLPGAVLGYAWQGRYFVITTSGEGLAEALRRLLG